MAQSGVKQPPARISGQTIINELIRNMELGRLELGFSILVPCVFSVYLHPDDFARISSVQDLLKEDARRALSARLAEWNAKPSLFRRGGSQKTYRIAQKDWWIELFADIESAVPPGDVEIHSELAEVQQPGYRGTKTTLIAREPSITSARVARDRENTRKQAPRVFAEIRYKDDTGPQTYFVTQDEVSIGRGGEDLWVDLPLYTTDEVSREHLRLRRDAATGAFVITDKSRNGTWLNGKRLSRGVEASLGDNAEIRVAEALKLTFEVRR
ncbi:MAG TPA: FHA domain-containing protein [Candidatus Acidoferrales bacterium]|nr:FHA domain-containing protein [Candidatus Acidoferrales bacterium]